MKPKELTITRRYSKTGNYNSISGEIAIKYDVETPVINAEAFEKGKTEVDTLLKKHFETQEDWMNKLIDKLPKTDVEGYK